MTIKGNDLNVQRYLNHELQEIKMTLLKTRNYFHLAGFIDYGLKFHFHG